MRTHEPVWWRSRVPQRRDVDGGVLVPRPGRVTSQLAEGIVADVEMEAATPGVLSRGRTYARSGQVVSVRVEAGEFTAAVQGSSEEPYTVSLRSVTISGSRRTDASCDCPFSCDFGWCKHAAALGYVAAYLLDTDPNCVATWTGTESAALPTAGLPVPPGLLERLLVTHPAPDAPAMLAACAAVVPLPAMLLGAWGAGSLGDSQAGGEQAHVT